MYYNGQDNLNLEQFMEIKRKEYETKPNKDKWEDSENYIWAVQEYLSSMGPLEGEDLEWLTKTDPELLVLNDELLDEQKTEE